MSSTMSDRVSLIVRCDNPDCGQGIEKVLGWLITVNRMACPHCGSTVNLESGYNGPAIQKLAQTCASIDAALDKLG